ncbi:MAG: hypothetical protein ABJF86_13230 [Tateyamaria sp.]|uniref:hypothetical protein n=1 Tax=Tateyamaria sp. TaxID=1929288 RepID=UPI0032883CF5
MYERMKKLMNICLCHRAMYGSLSASHGWAAWVTEKPEVYVPMLLLYAVLAVRG